MSGIHWGKLLAGFALAAAVASFGAGQAYAAGESGEQDKDTVIAQGVSIDGIDISGMTADEARQTVEEYVDSLENAWLDLTFAGQEGEEEERLRFSDLGFSWDNPEVVDQAAALGNTGNLLERYQEIRDLENENVDLPIEYSWDDSILREFLNEQAEERDAEPVNATMTRRGSGFEVTESVTGLSVDVNATIEAVKTAIETDGLHGQDVSLDAVVEVTEPELTTEMAESVQDILGEYDTPYNPAEIDRTQNLATACNYINGVILLPGESLSFFDYLYPVTAERGYRGAVAYQGGRYVDSLGGGLCQVSTTCYNAVLLAELDVLSRSPHSMTVSYVEPGLDSGQAWSSGKNLEFANNTDYPVYVEAWVSGGTLYIGLWGKETRPDNRTIRYGSDVTEEWPYAGQTVYEYDPSLPYGVQQQTQGEYPKATGHAYKEVYIDGELVSKEYLSDEVDIYRATPRYVSIGTGGLTQEEYLAGVLPEGMTPEQAEIARGEAPAETQPAQ